MESDALRSGSIFKLRPQELERVRSPPVVKFDLPRASSATKPQPTETEHVRETFLEIYRQTPVPKLMKLGSNGGTGAPWYVGGSSDPRPLSAPTLLPTSVRVGSIDSRQLRLDEQPERSTVFNDGVGAEGDGYESNSPDPNSRNSVYQSSSSSLRRNLVQPRAAPAAAPVQAAAKPSAAPQQKQRSVSAGRMFRGGTGDSLLMLRGMDPNLNRTAPPAPPAPRSFPATDGNVSSGVSKARVDPVERRLFGRDDPKTGRQGNNAASAIASSSSSSSSRTLGSQATTNRTNKQAPSRKRPVSDDSPSSGSDSETSSSRDQQTDSSANATASQPRKRGRPRKDATAAAPTHRLVTAKAAAQPSVSSAQVERPPPPPPQAEQSDSSVNIVPAKRRRGRPPKSSAPSGGSSGTAAMLAPVGRPQTKPTDTGDHLSSDGEPEGRENEKGIEDVDDIDDESDNKKAPVVTRSGRESIPKKVIPLLVEQEREERAEQKGPPKRGRPRKSATQPSTDTTAATAATAQPPKRVAKPSSASVTSAYNVHTALRGNADETGWTPAEKVALYSVQSRLDLRAPNFWELVSDALLDLGFEKSAKQCQQKWFEKMEETKQRQARKRSLQQDQPQQQQAGAAMATSTGTEEGVGKKDNIASTEEPPKPKRMTKAVLKRLAQESTRATHEDDIFDSDAFKGGHSEEGKNKVVSGAAPDGDLRAENNATAAAQGGEEEDLDAVELLTDELLAEFELPDGVPVPVSIGSGSGGSGSGGFGHGRSGLGEEDGEEDADELLVFGSSHVHKLNAKAPQRQLKVPSASASHDRAAAHASAGGSSGAGVGRLLDTKSGRVNRDLIRKQAATAVRSSKQFEDASDEDLEGDSSEESSGSSDGESVDL